MKHQTLKQPPRPVGEASPERQLAEILLWLWLEAEQAVAIRRVPPPLTRQTTSAERPIRVRFVYD